MEHSKIPLTLEQLYQMEGEPVWVVSLSQKGEKTVHQDWFIVVIEDLRLAVKRPSKFGYYICGADTYGKTWLAYAQKPIDFDEWEPCDFCKSICKRKRCDNCEHGYDTTGENENCTNCIEGSEWKSGFGFCPFCGRPLEHLTKPDK